MKIKILTCLLILVLFTGLFGACSSTTSTSAKPTPSSITVSLGGSAQLNTLDPHQMAGSYVVLCNIMDFAIAMDTNKKLVPSIASSWSYSSDFKKLTVKVRDDIKFSNGKPLTAKDVVWSLKRVGTTQPPVMDQFRNAGFVDAVVVDDHTFTVEIGHPSATWLVQTMSQFLISSEDYFNEVGEAEFAKKPIGTGPYKVVGYKEAEYLDLEYNEYYWGPAPQVKKVRILSTTDANTNVKMLQAGEVDFITGVPMQSEPALKQDGYNIKTFANTQTQGLSFALVNPNTPWKNLKVRQAINYAIDQDAIINTLFHGVPQKVEWQDPKDLGYDPTLKAVYPYDLAKAKQLMAEAGYPNGFDFTVTYVSDVTGIKDIADYIASSLKAININVKLNGMAFGPQFFEYLGKEAKDTTSQTGAVLWEISGPGQEDPCITLMYDFYSLKNAFFTTPELDGIIGKALVTPDDAQREVLIRQAYGIVNDNLPMIPICRAMSVMAFKSNITLTQTQYNMGKSGWIEDITIK